MRVLNSTETGSGPVSREKLSLTGPFQDFYQFVEDRNNVHPKWLPNGCFPYLNGCFHLLSHSITLLSLSSDHTLIVKIFFINKGNCITFFFLVSTCSKFSLSRSCCVFRILVWLTSYLLRLLTVKCRM